MLKKIVLAFLEPFLFLSSLRSRRLEVKKKRAFREGDTPRVSPSRAPVLSFAHYFQAPATQASFFAENNLLFQRMFYC